MSSRLAMHAILSAVFVLVGTASSGGEEGAPSVFGLSLEELMHTQVSIGSVVGTTLSKAPVSITTITSDQIAVSPARNLADLIEIYVPGALWLNHLSPKVGLRGLIIDRNYKVLLLVNGRNLSQKGTQGATLELQNWDLQDIERVEVVRGPGSVTYGPGAIAGIINIITKTAATSPGGTVGVNYVSGYDSRGVYGSYGLKTEDYGVYAYVSVRETDGYEEARYFTVDPDTGAGLYESGDDLIPYKGDNRDRSQVKAHLDVSFLEEWRAWARFTRSGTPTDGLEHGRHLVEAAGEFVPPRFSSQEGVVVALENEHEFSDGFKLASLFSYDCEHYTDYLIADASKAFTQDPFQGDPPGNVVYDFEESELFARLVGHITTWDHCKLALGYEFSHDRYRPGDHDVMYMNLKTFTTDDGRSIQALMNDGFESDTHSVVGEASLCFGRLAEVMLSGRIDKNEYTDHLYSPRVAVVSELNERNVVKLIWQRSVRMSTAEELYKEFLNGREGDTEELEGWEFIYSAMLSDNMTLNTSIFMDEIDAIGWVGNQSKPVGELQLVGCEADLVARTESATFGLSHAVVKQLDWDNAEGVTKQGISTADYDVNGLNDEGNDLSNWAKHITKAYVTAHLGGDFTLHADAQIYWGWPGNKDYIDIYDAKYTMLGGDANWDALRDRLAAEEYSKTDVRLNASLAWDLPGERDATVTLFAINLLGTKRYGYSSGVSSDYPRKISWVEEPTVLGVRAELAF